MTTNVVQFPVPSAVAQPIGHFIRLGEAHNKLAELHAADRLPAKRVVVEASRFRHQRELIATLRDSGAETVLDTEVAELSSIAKFSGHARQSPWGKDLKAPMNPDDFVGENLKRLVNSIAQFAVDQRVDRALAPSQFLQDPSYGGWLKVALRNCVALREALDQNGGSKIVIDFVGIITHTSLNEADFRGTLLAGVADMPIEAMWLRSSGIDPMAPALTLKRYLAALAGFNNLGRPVVADCLGGLTAQVALAFGAVSGICHGIGERERFDAGAWHKEPQPRQDGDSFGRAQRVSLPGIFKSATMKELDVLMSARGAGNVVPCQDRRCCQHGHKSMIGDPRSHAAYQSFEAIRRMEQVPDLKRADDLLAGTIAQMESKARQVAMLKPSVDDAKRLEVDPDVLMKRFEDHSKRAHKVRQTLETLHAARRDDVPRAQGFPKTVKRSDEHKEQGR